MTRFPLRPALRLGAALLELITEAIRHDRERRAAKRERRRAQAREWQTREGPGGGVEVYVNGKWRRL